MIRPVSLLLALALVHAGCGEEGPSTSTKADLATLAFDSLKSGDFASFATMVPTAADTEWMFERMNVNTPEDRMKMLEAALARNEGFAGIAALAAERARKAFDEAREKAEAVFDWSGATFGGLVEEKSGSTDADGVEIADVHFYVDAGERREIFGLLRCANIEGRWISAGGLRFRPSPHSNMDEAKAQMTKRRLRMLNDMVTMYEQKHGKPPEDIEALRPTNPETDEPNAEMQLVDAWEQPLHLELVDGEVRLSSPGPDGTMGTEDDVVWPEPDAE